MGVGERADQRVGEHDAAYQVVLEVPFDGGADRFLEQRAPGVPVVDAGPQGVAVRQRFGERREDPLGDPPCHAVEPLPGLVLTVVAGEGGEGVAGVLPAHEQPRRPSSAYRRGVRGDGALAYGEVESEVVEDLPGQQ